MFTFGKNKAEGGKLNRSTATETLALVISYRPFVIVGFVKFKSTVLLLIPKPAVRSCLSRPCVPVPGTPRLRCSAT